MLANGSYLMLTYHYVPDLLDRRDPSRAGHLEHAREAKERGELVNIGAVGSPPTGGVLVFHNVGVATVERYAAEDPYVTAGLVTSHSIESWNVVG